MKEDKEYISIKIQFARNWLPENKANKAQIIISHVIDENFSEQ